jgi:hypothetical protein
MRYLDKVQVKMLLDWSGMPADMILEEELAKIETLINDALDEHYGNNTTLDLTTVTHEGKISEDAEEPGWTVDVEAVERRIPGDTKEEKMEWVRRRLEGRQGD